MGYACACDVVVIIRACTSLLVFVSLAASDLGHSRPGEVSVPQHLITAVLPQRERGCIRL